MLKIGYYHYTMKHNYDFTLPPNEAGIYALVHVPTSHVYIGQSVNLRRRFAEWRAVLLANLGHKNKALRDLMLASTPEDWQFRVLTLCKESELNDFENRAICKAGELGKSVLNAMVPSAPTHVPTNKSVRLSTITDADGRVLSHADVAKTLGTTTATVTKRLAKYRKRGVYTVTLEALQARSEQYRPQPKTASIVH